MNTPLESVFPGPEQSPGLALWGVTNSWQRSIRDALAPHGLTHMQFVLLARLVWGGGEGPVTQRELADAAGAEVMMTSQVVRALEKKGLLERAAHPSDKRAVALTATAAGIELANQANASVEAADAAYFAPLGSKAGAFLEALHLLDAGPTRKGRGVTASARNAPETPDETTQAAEK